MSSSTYIVAEHYCVSHIPAATSLGSRLSNLLVRMHQGHSLTEYGLDFLRRQDLPGLYRLACGEITHEAYIAEFDGEYLARHEAAKAALQAKESERQAREAHYSTRRAKYRSPKAAPKMDWEAERKLRRAREQEATEAVNADLKLTRFSRAC